MSAKQEEHVVFRVEGGTIIVVLNRPDENNVLNNEMRGKIMDFLKTYEDDRKVKSVIFTSNGKNFSAGADLRYLLSLEGAAVKEYVEFVRRFLEYVENYPKVTIGAVRGAAVGGGLELLLALDIVVATPDARFGQTELNVGLIPGGGGTQRLARIVGPRRAREMIFTGRLIDSEEALKYGLINRVVPEEALMEEAFKIAQKVNEKSWLSITLAKRAINRQWEPLRDAFHLESELYAKILADPDGKEGIRAFLEKRRPNYSENV